MMHEEEGVTDTCVQYSKPPSVDVNTILIGWREADKPVADTIRSIGKDDTLGGMAELFEENLVFAIDEVRE